MKHTNTNNKSSVMPVWLQFALGLWLGGVAASAIFYLPPGAHFRVPEWARLIILHVPCAMIAVVGYIVSTIYAIAYLSHGNLASDIKSSVAAGLGFVFTVLAIVTGMVFAYIQWGMAWNWDPREWSILVLLIIYAAYFALRSSIPGTVVKAKISAAYNILACVVMPYLVFVLPRMTSGLHPSDTLTNRQGLSTEYRIVLIFSIIGFLWLFIWLFRIYVRVREEKTARKKKRTD